MKTYIDWSAESIRDELGRDIPKDLANRDYRKAMAEMQTSQAQLVPRPELSAMAKWEAKMIKSDGKMTRHIEDLITLIGTTNLPAATKATYDAKKALRATKP